jgi:hypothetical protein
MIAKYFQTSLYVRLEIGCVAFNDGINSVPIRTAGFLAVFIIFCKTGMSE